MGLCSVRDNGYMQFCVGMVPGRRSVVQIYGLWGGMPLAFLLLNTLRSLWYASGITIVMGRTGSSIVVEATTRWGKCRHWWWQCWDNFVISLFFPEIWWSWHCIQGKPRLMGCIVVVVTRNEIVPCRSYLFVETNLEMEGSCMQGDCRQ